MSCSWRKPKLTNEVAAGPQQSAALWDSSSAICCVLELEWAKVTFTAIISLLLLFHGKWFFSFVQQMRQRKSRGICGTEVISESPAWFGVAYELGIRRLGLALFSVWLWSESSATETSELGSQWNWHQYKGVWANLSNNCLVSRGLSKKNPKHFWVILFLYKLLKWSMNQSASSSALLTHKWRYLLVMSNLSRKKRSLSNNSQHLFMKRKPLKGQQYNTS